ncbi:MAG: hypothetical protein OEW83_21690 [Acidimicrobiia bacterium]|nr:hypothetical protein [Acidimicrobiia bacterium]
MTEIRGRKDNPRIIEYHASTSLKASNDGTAWCSSFVNWCVSQAWLTGTNSAAAFFVRQSDSRVTLLGGNQGDAVTGTSYGRDRVISYIMPVESAVLGTTGSEDLR